MHKENLICCLRHQRDRLLQLTPSLSHGLQVASDPDLLNPSPDWITVRWIPSSKGARCDGYVWDRWSWSVRGQQDLAAFQQVAEALGRLLRDHAREEWQSLVPAPYPDAMGTPSNLFLMDYWMLVVHHMGWQGLFASECSRIWEVGQGVEPPFRFASSLGQTVVQASLDTVTVLMDALTTRPQVLTRRVDSATSAPPQPFPWRKTSRPPADLSQKSSPPARRREKRVTNIDLLTRELREHFRVAQDTARTDQQFDREPRLLPRPTKQELGKRVGLPEYAVTRCFQDEIAKELRLLYDNAEDLPFVLAWRG